MQKLLKIKRLSFFKDSMMFFIIFIELVVTAVADSYSRQDTGQLLILNFFSIIVLSIMWSSVKLLKQQSVWYYY